jgi:environmental stress-induced protein Ves
MIKLIAQSEYQKKIWKNGRGTTQEIAVSDEGMEFDWRMSMADIVESGPFSQFPGMDRILVLLTGSEIKLTHREVLGEKSLQLLTPYEFSGDWQTSTIINEKGSDFNLIYLREKFKGFVELINSTGEQSKSIQSKSIAAVFCLHGKITTEHGELLPRDTLLVHDDSCKLVMSGKTSYLFIQLNHIRQT